MFLWQSIEDVEHDLRVHHYGQSMQEHIQRTKLSVHDKVGTLSAVESMIA